jgi:hypothetical protein
MSVASSDAVLVACEQPASVSDTKSPLVSETGLLYLRRMKTAVERNRAMRERRKAEGRCITCGQKLPKEKPAPVRAHAVVEDDIPDAFTPAPTRDEDY